MKKLSIIVPVYNEERFVAQILDKLTHLELIDNFGKEIILVNDCSKDKTGEIIEEYINSSSYDYIHYFIHEKNQGKGAAIQTGIEKATGDVITIQDADLEYDPNELNILLRPIAENFAHVVYGSRFKGTSAHRVHLFWHYIGNKFLTTLSNIFTNLNLSDMETCYKMFKSEVFEQVKIREKRFGFEPEITAKVSRIPDIRIYEVGISYYGRSYNEGKKINWKDGFRAIYCILKYNIFSRN
jgi:glycosyltransferase involved in cell wall biosynthesis